MISHRKQIESIAKKILFSKSMDEEQKSISLLYSFYTNGYSKTQITKNTHLKNGIALSQKHAADCIKDYKRTARFIKGIHKAILSAFQKFPNQKINILYAGCGPYAPLIIPLLHHFKPEQVDLTLIDIHQHSINSVKKIISVLQYENYFSDITVADAATYSYNPDKTLHMVITETMFRALTNEPQVAITQNLASQLCENGILIPEEISLSIGYALFSEEPYLNHYEDTYRVKNSKNVVNRKQVRPLFVLNKETTIDSQIPFSYKSNWFLTPKDYDKTPDICIYTIVNIFSSILLKNEDSLITNPHCLGSLYNFDQHKQFKVQFGIQKIPKWEITLT